MKKENSVSFPEIRIKPFGKTEEGKEVQLYTLVNSQGVKVDITNYGGIVLRLFVPDRNGRLDDVVLGYNNLEDYFDNPGYLGALIGRYANRISEGEFTLNGQQYELACNDRGESFANHLHGGNKGFDSVVWDASPIKKDGEIGLNLRYLSADGEEGYPGNLEVEVNYILTTENVLQIEYLAETDKATPVNLTNHSYFNLQGEGAGDILNHIVQIKADSFTPVNEALIPTGEIESVTDTPFDFREPEVIGPSMDKDNEQLEIGGGFDVNYILDNEEQELITAAEVYEPYSGRKMIVRTREPGIQFYTGNSIKEREGKSGRLYKKHSGLCLETQHYPDSVHHDNFPSVILEPGEKYHTLTEYEFTTIG
ncbi:MAG: aldose epimerase family protein [Halanaerobiaceae bacterium]